MAENCFYCNYGIEENSSHHLVTFVSGEHEREEMLCTECYEEWLQGIKG